VPNYHDKMMTTDMKPVTEGLRVYTTHNETVQGTVTHVRADGWHYVKLDEPDGRQVLADGTRMSVRAPRVFA
jgi:hypothetical protein